MPNPEEEKIRKSPIKARGINKREYFAIHYWIRANYGKSTKCENTHCLGISKNFTWALKKGRRYEKNIKNFKQLCKSCHSRYDLTDESRKKIGKANRNRIYTTYQLRNRYKPVYSIDKNGVIIHYLSIMEASQATKIPMSSISLCLHGKYKYCGKGIKWFFELLLDK